MIGRYGWGFLTFVDLPAPLSMIFYRASAEVWGLMGLAGWAAALGLWALNRKHERLDEVPQPSRLPWAAATGIVLHAAAYLRLPHEAGYLIPLVPWALVLADRWMPSRAFAALAIGVLISPWILGLNRPGKAGGPTNSLAAIPLGGAVVLDPLKGPALLNLSERENRRRLIHRALEALQGIPDGSRVICGWLHSEMALSAVTSTMPRVELRVSLSEDEARRFPGRAVYYLPEQDLHNRRLTRFDPRSIGAQPLLPE